MTGTGKVLLDSTGIIREVDRGFADLMRSTPDRLVGRDVMAYTAPADRDRCTVLIDGVMADRQPVSTIKRLVRDDGSHIWVDNALAYVDDVDGAPGCRVTSSPVTLPDNWVEPNKLLRVAKFLEQSRRARAFAFNARLFTDPAWDMILLAYIHEAEGDVIDPHALFDAIGIAHGSGVRWLRALTGEGLIECEGPIDTAPCPFHLTSSAHERIERYLADLYNTLTPADRIELTA